MYKGLLHTHSMFRWMILIMLVVTIILGLVGWLGKKEWTKKDNISGLLLTIFIDIQFLVGFILYAFVSPTTKAAFVNFGAAMQDTTLRFYAVEHVLMMIIALALVHVGRAISKKATTPEKKHRTAVIFYGIALIVILAAIPWDRALL